MANSASNRSLSILLLILLFNGFTISFSKAQHPTFSWVKNLGGGGYEHSTGISVDDNGNVYTTGGFNSIADFDPDSLSYNLISNGGYDIYISKLDKNGAFKWAKSLGGVSDDHGLAITTNLQGNVIVTGLYMDSIDLNPNSGSQYTTTGIGIFILKLDSNGNFIWAKNIGAHGIPSAIKSDQYDNIYIGGHFNYTVDFDPGPGVYNIPARGGSHPDAFVLKLDPNGNFIWARSVGGNNRDYCASIAIDKQDNILIAGAFMDTADFDPGIGVLSLTAPNDFNTFICKLDASGYAVWARQIRGPSNGNAIKTDTYSNVYIVGNFSDTADFDPDTSNYEIISAGTHDLYILKLDRMGSFKWVKHIKETYKNIDYSLELDDSNNIYTSCLFNGIIDVDPDSGVVNLNSNNNYDAFILKLDNNGSYKWAGQITGNNTKWPHSIAIGKDNHIHLTGYFTGTVDFNPDSTAVFNLSTNGNTDAFILKLLGDNLSTYIPFMDNKEISLHPNPTTGQIVIQLVEESDVNIRVYNSVGQIIYQRKKERVLNYQFEILGNPGLYIIEIESEKFRKTHKILKI